MEPLSIAAVALGALGPITDAVSSVGASLTADERAKAAAIAQAEIESQRRSVELEVFAGLAVTMVVIYFITRRRR